MLKIFKIAWRHGLGMALIIAVVAALLPLSENPVSAESTTVVTFSDNNLETAIRQMINKPDGDAVYSTDLAKLTGLAAENRNIANLSGLEYCSKLTELDLSFNQINNLSPLSRITTLKSLNISHNPLYDISPLYALTGLTRLDISYCKINEISVLSHLTKLQNLQLQGYRLENGNVRDILVLSHLTSLTTLNLDSTQLQDITFLSNLGQLSSLDLDNNLIGDITPLARLIHLADVHLKSNQISDLLPLVANPTLGEGDRVDLRDNDLSNLEGSQDVTNVQKLIDRGMNVKVSYKWLNSQPQLNGPQTTMKSAANPSISGSLAQSVNPSRVPEIVSFSPASGSNGTSIVITGNGFTGATRADIGKENVQNFTVDSDSQITVTASDGATGKINITTPTGTASSSGDFIFENSAGISYRVTQDNNLYTYTLDARNTSSGKYEIYAIVWGYHFLDPADAPGFTQDMVTVSGSWVPDPYLRPGQTAQIIFTSPTPPPAVIPFGVCFIDENSPGCGFYYNGEASLDGTSSVAASLSSDGCYPSSGAKDVPTSIILNWPAKDDASGFDFRLGTDSTFNTVVYSQTGIPAPAYIVQNLKEDTTYYWEYRAINSALAGDWHLSCFTTLKP